MNNLGQTSEQGASCDGNDEQTYDWLLESFPGEMAGLMRELDAARRDVRAANRELEFLVDDLSRWQPGSTVRVAFRGGNPTLHRAIADAVAEIDEACSLTLDFGFDETSGTFREWSTADLDYAAEIRVSFDMPGYFSLVGTDSMNEAVFASDFPVGGLPGQRSLNLGGFDEELPPSWRRTVLHEFLHALSFSHEHQNLRGTCQEEFRWEDDAGYEPTTDSNGQFIADSDGRRPGIYTYLSGAPNNWDRDRVDHNLRADPDTGAAGPFDAASVMLYRFPPLFYKSNPSACAPVGQGSTLSDGDRQGLALLYSAVAAPADMPARLAACSAALDDLRDEQGHLESIDLRDRALAGLQARLNLHLAAVG